MVRNTENALFIVLVLLVLAGAIRYGLRPDPETCRGRHPFIATDGCKGTIGIPSYAR